MTYQTTIAQQRNVDFFDFFSALYLVVSDILLTHTLLAFNHTFFLPSYARESRGVTPVSKGLHGVSFVRCGVLFSERNERQYKERLVSNMLYANQCFVSLNTSCFSPFYYDLQIGMALLLASPVCKRCKCI